MSNPTPRTEAGRRLLASEGVLPLFIGAMAEDEHILRDFIMAIEAEAALSTTPAPDRLREALDKAVDAVLAYGAAPPEYPGLALVPQPDIERLRRIRTAIRVNDHEPHDQTGDPVEGFPTCSGCGAIQTDPALDE